MGHETDRGRSDEIDLVRQARGPSGGIERTDKRSGSGNEPRRYGTAIWGRRFREGRVQITVPLMDAAAPLGISALRKNLTALGIIRENGDMQDRLSGLIPLTEMRLGVGEHFMLQIR